MPSLLLDTNVLRKYARQQQGIHRFWDRVQTNADQFDLYVSDETIRELEVHAFMIEGAEMDLIRNRLLPYIGVLPYQGSVDREHQVRLVAAYIRKTYLLRVPSTPGLAVPIDQRPLMMYPGVSDARILLTAYDNDCGIVTNNVKDFMVYVCMGYPLWEPEDNYRIEIPHSAIERLSEDDYIQTQFHRFTS